MSLRRLRSLVLSVGLGAAVLGALTGTDTVQGACIGVWAASMLLVLRLDRLRLFGQRAVPPNHLRRRKHDLRRRPPASAA